MAPDNLGRLIDVCADITLPSPLHLRYGTDGGVQWLQIYADIPDAMGDCAGRWHGRKWRLSDHMTTSEIVRTAFAAAHAFVEHELRERFRYKGTAIFGPHIDVDALWSVAEMEDRRPQPQPAPSDNGPTVAPRTWRRRDGLGAS